MENIHPRLRIFAHLHAGAPGMHIAAPVRWRLQKTNSYMPQCPMRQRTKCRPKQRFVELQNLRIVAATCPRTRLLHARLRPGRTRICYHALGDYRNGLPIRPRQSAGLTMNQASADWRPVELHRLSAASIVLWHFARCRSLSSVGAMGNRRSQGDPREHDMQLFISSPSTHGLAQPRRPIVAA